MEAVRRSVSHLHRIALRVDGNKTITYGKLLADSAAIAAELARIPQLLTAHASSPPGPFVRFPALHRGPRIAIMAPPGEHYVQATWATWIHGGICVPLAVTNPPRELDYVLRDAGCSAVLATRDHLDTLLPIAQAAGAALLPIEELQRSESGAAASTAASESVQWARSLPEIARGVGSPGDAGALILYTSGTTGRPKGVLHSHGGLRAQAEGMIESWAWTPDDSILHALPLHHIHGVVNALYTPLLAGATVDLHKAFRPDLVWDAFLRHPTASVPSAPPPPTLFMGVPTMYARLVSHYDTLPPTEQRRATEAAARLRLFVSGSSACPVPLLERWRHVSGHVGIPLERYGMTEIGMALSNRYRPEEGRRPGSVGVPMPGVEAKIDRPTAAAAEEEDEKAVANAGAAAAAEVTAGERASARHGGELLIRSTGMFVEYWGQNDKTRESFTEDGYFRTGDTVACESVPSTSSSAAADYFTILGRTSVDILKTRGFKVSALQVENALLENTKMIAECAVFGLEDPVQGQIVAAAVVLRKGPSDAEPPLDLTSTKQVRGLELQLRAWLKAFLPPYAIPERWFFLPAVPRNAMGKVNKKELAKAFGSAAGASCANASASDRSRPGPEQRSS